MSMVTVPPLIVHTDVVWDVTVTARLDDAVGLTLNVPAVERRSVIAANVMVCAVGASTLNVRVTDVAGAYVVPPDAPPACTASIEHNPGPITSTSPAVVTVQIPDDVLGVTRNVTVKGDVVVAETVKSAAVDSLAVRALKVIVCAVAAMLVTVNEDRTDGAAAHSFVVPSTPPFWTAKIVQVPFNLIVTVDPLTVQTDVVSEKKLIVKFDVVVASLAIEKGGLVNDAW
jgi:hypothetical protein